MVCNPKINKFSDIQEISRTQYPAGGPVDAWCGEQVCELGAVVQVSADDIVVAVMQEAEGFFPDVLAIGSGKGAEVELELDAGVAEEGVVLHVHVGVALGVGEDGVVAAGADAGEYGREAGRRVVVGSLDEEVAAFTAYRQQVSAVQAVLEEGVHHVFGGQPENYPSAVGCPQFLKPLHKSGGGVGDILHHMRCQPYFPDAGFLVHIQNGQTILHGLQSIIDSRQDMAVPVGHAVQDSGLAEGVLAAEGEHEAICRYSSCARSIRNDSRNGSRTCTRSGIRGGSRSVLRLLCR